MIERGSGRTSGLTDWRLMDLLSMWACIQDHDTAGHWKQVAGWRKVCDLAQAHLGRLKEYRRGLAEAWPPATNAAAQAYLGELDDLIDKVQRTHDAAAANYDALAAATRAISSARAELKPLHDEYVEKLQQKRTYEATAADPKAAMGARVPDKPVTDADLERLNVQARNLMYGLSGELQQAQVMLRQPPKVRPPKQTDNPDVYGASAAPEIPPIIPVPLATTNSSSTPKSTGTPKGVEAASPPRISHGPILGGTNATFSPTSGISSTNPPLQSTSPTGPHPGPISIPPLSNTNNGHTTPRISPERLSSNFRPPGDGKTATPGPPNTPRPLPSGGIIGTPPSMGSGHHGNMNASRRINPIGGVIGGGAGTAPSGAAGSRPGIGRGIQFGAGHFTPPFGNTPGTGGAPFPGNTTGRLQAEGEGESRHWDPDHPWETDSGVTPVMRPHDENDPIDPGPAIGFDR
ncbi:hypothetical protein GA0070558_11176 [Micromonospora haikouensis]|uniref:PPE family protein n=1 Tax=Micromonospora haikouensis TaxID=686309 RepID=A0A1C4VUN0_9ACTN|nr:hypothetical protein [Micromonospora haikouensis]SCE87511.1 hypothetical protein GA0070558_11176 [Micromonospora haikouensis]